jgi:hypothetical protein
MRVGFEHANVSDASFAAGERQTLMNEVVFIVIA